MIPNNDTPNISLNPFIHKGLGAFVQNVLLASPQSDSTGSDGNQGTSGVSRYKANFLKSHELNQARGVYMHSQIIWYTFRIQ